MARAPSSLVCPFLIALLCAMAPRVAAQAFRCAERDTAFAQGAKDPAPVPFKAYRPRSVSGLPGRDLEFMWDPMNDSTLTANVRTTLDNFGMTLVDSTGRNPFGFPMSDFQLTYEYFKSPHYGLSYTLNPHDTSSVWVGSTGRFANPGYSTAAYNASDRSHSDVYMFYPSRKGVGGEQPSVFISGEEDLSTGHSADDVKPGNSLMIFTPTGASRLDLTGTGWTRPDALRNVGFNHEFRHSLPGTIPPFAIGEMFSAGAEAIGGNDTIEDEYDFPYTWSLFAWGGAGGDTTNLRWSTSNYQGRSAFAAYLAYNFHGADTSATLVGLRDDLLHHWASDSSSSIATLARLLRDDRCSDCATKAYFHPGGVAMSDSLRLGLLHHDFRVANYCNAPALEEGQYGYAPQFGFSPPRHLSAWKDVDHIVATDLTSLPEDVTLATQHLARDTTFRDLRANSAASYPLVLTPYGSQYWILRSDPAIQSAGKTLVVRIIPDSANVIFQEHTCGVPSAGPRSWTTGRLFASVLGYRERSDSLWKHPEWIARVLAPRWTDIDSLGGQVLEFAVPSFGDSLKAVLVVLSLATDGRDGEYYEEWLAYRLQAAIRTAPFMAQNPVALASYGTALEESPTFSPDGGWLAYSETPVSGLSQIYVRSIDGQTRYALNPTSWPRRQLRPDWSPRGDWLAYEEWRALWPHPDIHLFNPSTAEERMLTPGIEGADEDPAFSPNGQQVAYSVHFVGASAELDSIWQLRRIDLSGTNDVVLVQSAPSRPLRSPRWSPDGQWLYFTANDSLYAVGTEGGAQGVVVDRTNVLHHAPSFDLHRGRGPMVYEEADSSVYWRHCYIRDVTPWEEIWGRFKVHPYRRIALRDTLQRLPLPHFQQSGVMHRSPRWSYGGTRIAYVSDEAAPGSARDIYLGQVSWNHAPVFTATPRDTVLAGACSQTFTQSFAAIDPDGEVVTFEAASLPPGASLSASGLFTWQEPGPPGSEHFTVVRALDGSGGVAQKVVRFAVAADLAPPAAALDPSPAMGKTSATLTWTEVGDDSLTGTACRVRIAYSVSPITETNFFAVNDTIPTPGTPGEPGLVHCEELAPGKLVACTWYYFALKTRDDAGRWSSLSPVVSGKTKCSGTQEVMCGGEGLMAQGGGEAGWVLEAALLEGGGVEVESTDAWLLRQPLKTGGDDVRVRLEQRPGAATALDAVSLAAVDHAPDEQVWLTGSRVLLGVPEAAASIMDDAGVDRTQRVSGAGPALTVLAGTVWDVVLDDRRSKRAALLLEVEAGGRGSNDAVSDLIRIEARGRDDEWSKVVDWSPRHATEALVLDSLPDARLRVEFGAEALVRRLVRIDVHEVVTPSALELTAATHSRAGVVTAAVTSVGGADAGLRPRESVVAAFRGTRLVSGRVRDHILTVRGRPTSIAAMAALRPQIDEARPRAFALHPAEPNPFTHATRIRFDLPRPTRVRLDVFDLQGRRVATLAKGTLSAGFHEREWNGRGDAVARVAPGVYLYRLVTDEHRSQRKLVLMP